MENAEAKDHDICYHGTYFFLILIAESDLRPPTINCRLNCYAHSESTLYLDRDQHLLYHIICGDPGRGWTGVLLGVRYDWG